MIIEDKKDKIKFLKSIGFTLRKNNDDMYPKKWVVYERKVALLKDEKGGLFQTYFDVVLERKGKEGEKYICVYGQYFGDEHFDTEKIIGEFLYVYSQEHWIMAIAHNKDERMFINNLDLVWAKKDKQKLVNFGRCKEKDLDEYITYRKLNKKYGFRKYG